MVTDNSAARLPPDGSHPLRRRQLIHTLLYNTMTSQAFTAIPPLLATLSLYNHYISILQYTGENMKSFSLIGDR
jgi:hypothetical protein